MEKRGKGGTHHASGISFNMTAVSSTTSDTWKSFTSSCMTMPLPASGGARMEKLKLPTGRREGLEGVLRVRAKGRAAQELRGLPDNGLLYPVICIVNDRQKVAMVPVP